MFIVAFIKEQLHDSSGGIQPLAGKRTWMGKVGEHPAASGLTAESCFDTEIRCWPLGVEVEQSTIFKIILIFRTSSCRLVLIRFQPQDDRIDVHYREFVLPKGLTASIFLYSRAPGQWVGFMNEFNNQVHTGGNRTICSLATMHRKWNS